MSRRSGNWTDDPVWKQYAAHFLKDVLPEMAGSAVMVSIAPRDGTEGDVKYWVELGASIMLDKPIVVVAQPGQRLPAKLLLVADQVIRGDMSTEAGQKALSEGLALFMARHFGDEDPE